MNNIFTPTQWSSFLSSFFGMFCKLSAFQSCAAKSCKLLLFVGRDAHVSLTNWCFYSLWSICRDGWLEISLSHIPHTLLWCFPSNDSLLNTISCCLPSVLWTYSRSVAEFSIFLISSRLVRTMSPTASRHNLVYVCANTQN